MLEPRPGGRGHGHWQAGWSSGMLGGVCSEVESERSEWMGECVLTGGVRLAPRTLARGQAPVALGLPTGGWLRVLELE
jgi:hypothetical protein